MFNNLPTDVLSYICEWLTGYELLSMRLLSIEWKDYIDIDERFTFDSHLFKIKHTFNKKINPIDIIKKIKNIEITNPLEVWNMSENRPNMTKYILNMFNNNLNTIITTHNSEIDNDIIDCISNVENFSCIRCNNLTDEGLKKLKNLKVLRIWDQPRITDEYLSQLKLDTFIGNYLHTHNDLYTYGYANNYTYISEGSPVPIYNG